MIGKKIRMQRLFNGNLNKENIVIVGHGALFRFMLPEIFTNIDHSFATNYFFKNTDYSIAKLKKNYFICTKWCDQIITEQ